MIVDSALAGAAIGSVMPIFGGLLIGFPIVAGLTIFGESIKANMSSYISRDIRLDVFEHLQTLTLAFYKRSQLGDLLSRFASDVNSVENNFMRTVDGAIAVATILLCLPILALLEWHLTALMVLSWPLIALLSKQITARAYESIYQFQKEQGKLLNKLQENLRGQPVIQGFFVHKTTRTRFEQELHEFRLVRAESSFFKALLEQTSVLSLLFSELTVTCAGAYLAIAGTLSAGSLIAFLTLQGIINKQLYTLARQTIPQIINASGSTRRLEELFQETPDIVDAPHAVELPPFSEAIRFENVSFGYTKSQQIINAIDLTIPAGQYVAFVGSSGAGKSTILSLLMRFYDVTEGRMTIDGQDVSDVTQESLRSQMGVVFQEPFLFDISILDNIRLVKQDATLEEVKAASKAAEIHDFIMTLPQGYDTHGGDAGGRLSGGQRQRISIARALVRQPTILILDEPTASLDAETSAALNITLNSLAQERTVISVTHQLLSVINADKIFVLEAGDIVETGTHEELLMRRGSYHQLWHKQQTGQSETIQF